VGRIASYGRRSGVARHTVRRLELRDAVVGERWRVGTAVLEVAQPRLPRFKLGIRLGDDDFPRRFPDHGVTLRSMIDALGDRERLAYTARRISLTTVGSQRSAFSCHSAPARESAQARHDQLRWWADDVIRRPVFSAMPRDGRKSGSQSRPDKDRKRAAHVDQREPLSSSVE
jgi:MOSC domain-containing protein